MTVYEYGGWEINDIVKGYSEIQSLYLDVSNEMIHMEEEVAVTYE